MKFISTSSAKGLEIDTPCYTLSEDGSYGLGRLTKVERTAKGTVYTFELATFVTDGQPPSIKPTVSTTVSHVAIIKPRSNGTED